MSAFAIFTLVLTVLYVIYYSVIIMQDTYGKKDAPKSDEEEIDVGQMQDSEEPTSVSESSDVFRIGNDDEAQQEQSGITFIENEEDAERYQEKVENERRNASEGCTRLEDALDDIDVESTGATEADVMLQLLLNQKPGGPTIFQKRDNL